MKKTKVPRRVYQKVVTVAITGTSKAAIQSTASKIYALSTDKTMGGAAKRSVQITKMDSTDCKQVFLGKI